MTPIELIAGQLNWANKNICNNIDFIPEDKMNWKPEPKAKSPLEIVEHMTGTLAMMTGGLKGEAAKELPTPGTRDEAKKLVSQVIQDHVAYIKTLSDEQLAGTTNFENLGEFPTTMAAALPVIETINHHGQLTYIQTLMGDDESHLILH